jgi:NhaA family Na+:H+ antiporter
MIPTYRNRAPSRGQLLAERAFVTVHRFMHIEAVSGIILLIAATIALIWANSPFAASYHALWHLPLSIGIGEHTFSRSLHFWINDALMTIFFLIVGMEIRREIHEGALSKLDQAALPLVAAAGGVIVPALIYLGMNGDAARNQGWAVPTATDIAFAVGVLALLGRAIPGNIRIFLLAVAIIDDVIAVLIIAFFYSGGLDATGFAVAAVGLLMVFGLQWIGIGSAMAYVAPGAVVWVGVLMTGAHPTLAGVVLGLMTPIFSIPMRDHPMDVVSRVANTLRARGGMSAHDEHHIERSLRELRLAQREMLPPVVRVQTALHPWVAFIVMPLFALANAGVSVEGVDLFAGEAHLITLGVGIALVVGKPIGIMTASWGVVRLGFCRLPPGVDWRGVFLVSLLAGIGFTMSIFIATLAFSDANYLASSKLGVLLGSLMAAILGLGWGTLYKARLRPIATDYEEADHPVSLAVQNVPAATCLPPAQLPKHAVDKQENDLSCAPDKAARIMRIVVALIPGAIAVFMLAKILLLVLR